MVTDMMVTDMMDMTTEGADPETTSLPSPRQPESGLDWIRNYFIQLKAVLFQPTRFFREFDPATGLGTALTFGLVTHWIGSILQYIWLSLTSNKTEQFFKLLLQQYQTKSEIHGVRSSMVQSGGEQFINWFVGFGSLLTDPFVTLMSAVFFSSVIFVGARLFIGATGPSGLDVRWKTVLTLYCFALAGSIFRGVPLIGNFIATVWTFIIGMIAFEQRFAISRMRAAGVLFFPTLLFLFIVIFVLLFFGVVLFQLFQSFFS